MRPRRAHYFPSFEILLSMNQGQLLGYVFEVAKPLLSQQTEMCCTMPNTQYIAYCILRRCQLWLHHFRCGLKTSCTEFILPSTSILPISCHTGCGSRTWICYALSGLMSPELALTKNSQVLIDCSFFSLTGPCRIHQVPNDAAPDEPNQT